MAEIEEVKKEYEEILNQLSDPELISDWKRFEELSKKKNFLEKIVEKEKEIKEMKNKIEENKAIISAKEDLELVSLAEEELSLFQKRGKILEKELEDLLSEKDIPSHLDPALSPEKTGSGGKSVIIEIRAGAGGEEAALFVADLFRIYSKYALSQSWRQKTLDSKESELGGFKEIIFELTPEYHAGEKGDAFSKMKYEGGVHRVQRIPTTEKTGRIHTSTVSVAVLLKPKKAEMKISPNDLKIDTYKSSGAGGQNVNKRMTAVRIAHLPTGIVVTSQTERNLQRNKENAMSILEARLLEKQKMAEDERTLGKRKAQIGWAKRAEKIRTYNFPQDRVTDHRIKKNWKRLERILNGELEPIIEALQKSALS